MNIRYLEIVTDDIGGVKALYETIHAVTFGPPVEKLGGAIVAKLEAGREIGIRGRLRPDEDPVIRPYWQTDNLGDATDAAEKAGAQVAVREMAVEGGLISIVLCGGIDTGFWQDA